MPSSQNNSQHLLPVGFYDLLFDEAKKNHQNINLALDIFFAAGFNLIKTPLVEFESTISGFANKKEQNAFHAIDTISGKNLIFRNDITPQISRLLATRFRQETLPLKLCYVGDVLCAESENLYSDRQQTQVGVEIIGCNDNEHNAEIIRVLLSVLRKIDLGKIEHKNLLIEFSCPDFLGIFLEEVMSKNDQNHAMLHDAVMKKNISMIKKLAGKNGDIISKIALQNHNLEELVPEISTQIKSEKIVTEIKKRLQKVEKISNAIKSFLNVEVRFDIFGDRESSYHSEISFDVFCGDFAYPIARGGRYKISNGNENLNAVGATIYMNRLRVCSE